MTTYLQTPTTTNNPNKLPMYRITYSEEISHDYRSKIELPPATLKRRVYRFGTLWGILEDGKWTCERRVPILQTAEYIVEACTVYQCDVLPKEVDDLWEEEYVPLSKGIEYTGLLKVYGDSKTVLEILATHGLPSLTLPALPSTPSTQTGVPSVKPTHYNNNQKGRTEKRCMIRD